MEEKVTGTMMPHRGMSSAKARQCDGELNQVRVWFPARAKHRQPYLIVLRFNWRREGQIEAWMSSLTISVLRRSSCSCRPLAGALHCLFQFVQASLHLLFIVTLKSLQPAIHASLYSDL